MLLGVKLDWPEGLAVRAMQVRVFAKFGVCRLRGLLCKFGGHDFATQLDACQSWKLGLVLRRGMLLANAAWMEAASSAIATEIVRSDNYTTIPNTATATPPTATTATTTATTSTVTSTTATATRHYQDHYQYQYHDHYHLPIPQIPRLQLPLPQLLPPPSTTTATT